MADNTIDEYIHQIEMAVRGEDVRTAIIEAIKSISLNRDANTLDGYASSAFVRQSDFEKLLPIATTVQADDGTQDGTGAKPITSGAVYNYIAENISSWLDNTLGEASDDTTVQDKLKNVFWGKYNIWAACEAAGISFGKSPENTTLSEIADAISNRLTEIISTVESGTGNTVELDMEEVTFTQNNTDANPYYIAPEGKAYKKVTVNVKPNLETLSVTDIWDKDKKEASKTFEPGKDEDIEGYSKVTVDVSRHIKELSINKVDEKGKATFKIGDENKDDEPESGYVYGYSKVTVDVSSQIKTKTINKLDDLPDDPSKITVSVKDENSSDDDDDEDSKKVIGFSKVTVDVTPKLDIKPIEVDPTNVGEEYTYTASDDNLYGWHTVTISIKEAEGPFEVEFYNDRATLLWTAHDVPKNGNVVYSGTTQPSKEGCVFSGWNPKPENVTRNLKCYAQFEEKKHIGYDNEVPKTWGDIGANGGIDLPIGAWKIVHVKPFTYGGVNYQGCAFLMQKVAGGSSSTWISLNTFPYALPLYTNSFDENIENANGWEQSDLRSFFNSGLKACLVDDSGEPIGSAIKTVTKYTYSFLRETSTIDANGLFLDMAPNTQSSDDIWIPSYRELTGKTGRETMPERSECYSFTINDENGVGIVLPSGYSLNRAPRVRSLKEQPSFGVITNSIVQSYPELKGDAGRIYSCVMYGHGVNARDDTSSESAVGWTGNYNKFPIYRYFNKELCDRLMELDSNRWSFNYDIDTAQYYNIGFCT